MGNEVKYWFFDGNDVIGPFSPQELAARTDFSATSMLAPETESENQQSWKMASSFPEFQFDEKNGSAFVQVITPPHTEPVQEIPVPNFAASQPAVDIDSSSDEFAKSPKPILLTDPIKLTEETEDIVSLPQEKQDSEEPLAEKPQADVQHLSSTTQTTCTLPMADEPLPNTKSSLPIVDQFSGQTENTDSPEEDPQTIFADIEDPSTQTNSYPEDAEGPEEISVREVLKPNLESTPEIDAFLKKEATRPNREKAKIMLWILLLLLLPGMIAWGIHFYLRSSVPNPSPADHMPVSTISTPVATQKEPSVTEVPMHMPVPEIKTPSVDVKPREPSLSDQAIDIVKNHTLAANKGTISSYFDRIYKSQLSSGYSGEWSAEPLHKSVYIVKYRLTKTRTEPIVYVFQADVSKKKLTGALNNITLDLVGKI